MAYDLHQTNIAEITKELSDLTSQKSEYERERMEFKKYIAGNTIRQLLGAEDWRFNSKFYPLGTKEDSNEFIVFVSEKGKLYHGMCGCKDAKIPVSIAWAVKEKRPCSLCGPDKDHFNRKIYSIRDEILELQKKAENFGIQIEF